MEPIVSPWLVYMLAVINNLRMLVIISLSMLGVGVIFFFAFWMVECDVQGRDTDEALRWKNSLKRLFSPFLILLVIWALFPTRNTLIGMFVAKNITYNRVDKTIQTGKQLHQTIKRDILELIDKLNYNRKEEDKKEKNKEE